MNQNHPVGVLAYKILLSLFMSSLAVCFLFVIFFYISKLEGFEDMRLPKVFLVAALVGLQIFGYGSALFTLIGRLTSWPVKIGWAGVRIGFGVLGFALYATGTIMFHQQNEWLQNFGLAVIAMSVLSTIGWLPSFNKK